MGLRDRALVAVVVTGLFVLSAPLMAAADDAAVGASNFAESRGCSPYIAGTSRPTVGTSGRMSQAEIMRGPWGDMFGRTFTQVSESLVYWRVPGTYRSIRVHRRILPALALVTESLNAHFAAGKSYEVYSAYGWVWRTVGGTYRPSEHAFGTAFDINPSDNPYSGDNVLRTDFPAWFVQSFVDAGFCWGGDWVDVKDAMHFSWSGPQATPNYPARPAPYPPVTAASSYRGTTLAFSAGVGTGANSTVATGDITGNGVPDLVRLSSSGRIEVAGAFGGYRQIALREYSPRGSVESLLGDYDLDGRADVWVPDRSGEFIVFDVWTYASGFTKSIRVQTSVPSASVNVMLGMYDGDFTPDVYASDGSVFSVWGSIGGYTAVVSQLAMPAASDASWHFATGDHDVDGRADIYAVSNGASPTLSIRLAGGSSVIFSPSIAVSAGDVVDFADYDGDGRDDMFVLSGTSLSIALAGVSNSPFDSWFATSNGIPDDAGPECVHEPCDTIGVISPGGVWSIADRPRTAAEVVTFYYGNPGDKPFSGDWNCDGVDTPGLYRQSDGFVYLRNTNTQGNADIQFFFGNPGDVPLAGDFNGDGCDTVSLFRPSERRVYVINTLGDEGRGLGEAEYFFAFGDQGDIPFVGDFNGDGRDEVSVFRPSAGRIYLKWALDSSPADVQFLFGIRGDVPIAGDWNGDGIDTVALYRRSTEAWYIRTANAQGPSDHVVHIHSHEGMRLPIAGKTES